LSFHRPDASFGASAESLGVFSRGAFGTDRRPVIRPESSIGRHATIEEITTIRRPFRAPPPPKEGPRINREIRGVPQVQLIDDDGNNVGVLSFFDAIDRAEEAGLDLVEIAPQAVPPVCKLLDFGRFKYQAQKKAAEARRNQKIVEIKEVKLRPGIDDHDYDVKMRQSRQFFEDGDKVKITLRFRGREMAHQDLGVQLLDRVRTDVGDVAKVESEPRLEGKQMIMILAPR
jgi:translation initiation factor IF-3